MPDLRQDQKDLLKSFSNEISSELENIIDGNKHPDSPLPDNNELIKILKKLSFSIANNLKVLEVPLEQGETDDERLLARELFKNYLAEAIFALDKKNGLKTSEVDHLLSLLDENDYVSAYKKMCDYIENQKHIPNNDLHPQKQSNTNNNFISFLKSIIAKIGQILKSGLLKLLYNNRAGDKAIPTTANSTEHPDDLTNGVSSQQIPTTINNSLARSSQPLPEKLADKVMDQTDVATKPVEITTSQSDKYRISETSTNAVHTPSPDSSSRNDTPLTIEALKRETVESSAEKIDASPSALDMDKTVDKNSEALITATTADLPLPPASDNIRSRDQENSLFQSLTPQTAEDLTQTKQQILPAKASSSPTVQTTLKTEIPDSLPTPHIEPKIVKPNLPSAAELQSQATKLNTIAPITKQKDPHSALLDEIKAPPTLKNVPQEVKKTTAIELNVDEMILREQRKLEKNEENIVENGDDPFKDPENFVPENADKITIQFKNPTKSKKPEPKNSSETLSQRDDKIDENGQSLIPPNLANRHPQNLMELIRKNMTPRRQAIEVDDESDEESKLDSTHTLK